MSEEMSFVRDLSDLSFPFALLIVVVFGLKRVWSDVWTWWKDTYWTTREKRWKVTQESFAERDRIIEGITSQYITTMREYQDGFRTQSALEHQQIIGALGEQTTKVTNVLSELAIALHEWRAETLGLVALMEGRTSNEN